MGARNRLAGGRQAINSGGIAMHSSKEWSRGGCKGICVLAVFPTLHFPEELYGMAGEECQYTHRVPGLVVGNEGRIYERGLFSFREWLIQFMITWQLHLFYLSLILFGEYLSGVWLQSP